MSVIEEMKIPEDILERYGIQYSKLLADLGTSINQQVYYMFLSKTDYEIVKSIESMFETLSTATPLNFITTYISANLTLWKDISEVVKYRKIAREELENEE